MLAVQSFLLLVCTWCFGRLLLAVFRVRRATIKSQTLRNRALQEERIVYIQQTTLAGQSGLETKPPILPPVKTNRWLISKTFLVSKASSAANTVSVSLHRRSASNPQTTSPSTTSASQPRPSTASLFDDVQIQDTRFGFLAFDPVTTTRFGQFGASIGGEAEPQILPQTPRSITFSQDVQARTASPAPTERFGAFSRLTSQSGARISTDEPRPSTGSYVSIESNSTECGGVSSFLSTGRLLNPRSNGLNRLEARKAGARLGGNLSGCIASWTCALPFLVYKINNPSMPAPFYADLILAIGISM